MMNKFHFLAVFCLLASIAIGVDCFARGKTSSRKSAASNGRRTSQEQYTDGSDNVKGIERPADESGSLSRGVQPVKDASGSSSSSSGEEASHPAPEPYSFAYSANTDDGATSTREETGDRDGRVTGFYVLNNIDGTERRVNYVADETGFHATITTNEEGPKKDSADVTFST